MARASGGASGDGGASGGTGGDDAGGSAGGGGESGGTAGGGASGGAGGDDAGGTAGGGGENGGTAGVCAANGGAAGGGEMPVTPTMPVGEALWPQQNLLDIHMPEAWGLPGGGALVPNLGVNRVYTCLIDNGAQSFTGGGGNPELVRPGNFGWDIGGVAAATLGAPTGPGAAEGGHGTACAGIIGADWQATSGVVGVAPLSPIFSLALTVPAVTFDVTGAINAAVTTALPNADPGATAERDKQHRRVILLSAFHDAYAATPALSTAIANAIAADVPVIVPSGDDDTSTIPYPATDPGVIVCGAVRPTTGARVSAEPLGHGTNNGGASWGSNFSATQPFVSAPGFAITSTDLNGAAGYGAAGYVTNFQGTAAAAAHAAGVATLLLAHNPRLTANDVRTILYRTADKVGGVFSPSDTNHPAAMDRVRPSCTSSPARCSSNHSGRARTTRPTCATSDRHPRP
ncbi:MAG TPA: S8 family serine peptidase [Polyangiaceae bacterium]